MKTALTLPRSGSSLDKNRLFLATLGPGHLPRGWLSIHGKGFGGATQGHAASVSFGMHARMNTRLRFGIFASAAQAALERQDMEVSVDGMAIGPYFSRRVRPRSNLTGWFQFSRPRFRLGSASWHATRWSGALSYEGYFDPKWAELSGQARIATFGEAHPGGSGLPANAIVSVRGRAGAKAAFRPGKSLRPHIEVSLDTDLSSDAAAGEELRRNRSVAAGLRYARDHTRISVGIASHAMNSPTKFTADFNWRF